MRDYRDLRVWNAAVDLAVDVFETTRRFPPEEKFGAVTQMRQSANSIAANIAEGFGREQTGSYIHFLRIAQGSLKELETHAVIATRVKMLDPLASERLLSQTTSIGKMLRAYIRSLSARLEA
ncbi:MAG: four helix bundle protein [Pseudomonadota bacterium]